MCVSSGTAEVLAALKRDVNQRQAWKGSYRQELRRVWSRSNTSSSFRAESSRFRFAARSLEASAPLIWKSALIYLHRVRLLSDNKLLPCNEGRMKEHVVTD